MLENLEDLHGELQECVIEFNQAYKRLSKLRDTVEDQITRLLTPRAPDPAATEAIVQDIMTEAETYLASEDYDDFERFLHERLGG